MNRIFITLMLLIFCCCGCLPQETDENIGSADVHQIPISSAEEPIQDAEIVAHKGVHEGVQGDWSVDFDNIQFPITDYKIDEDLAYEIATAVFKSMYGNEYIESTHWFSYDVPSQDLFVVWRGEWGRFGGWRAIALSKTNGAVLAMWEEE